MFYKRVTYSLVTKITTQRVKLIPAIISSVISPESLFSSSHVANPFFVSFSLIFLTFLWFSLFFPQSWLKKRSVLRGKSKQTVIWSQLYERLANWVDSISHGLRLPPTPCLVRGWLKFGLPTLNFQTKIKSHLTRACQGHVLEISKV